MIERVVDFHRVEMTDVMVEPLIFRKVAGIENLPPMVILIAGCADAGLCFSLCHVPSLRGAAPAPGGARFAVAPCMPVIPGGGGRDILRPEDVRGSFSCIYLRTDRFAAVVRARLTQRSFVIGSNDPWPRSMRTLLFRSPGMVV